MSRRAVLGTGVGGLALAALESCADLGRAGRPGPSAATAAGSPARRSGNRPTTAGQGGSPTSGGGGDGGDRGGPGGARLIGDGSTSDTGPQPRQPPVTRLAPGQAPPQFVVLSWDGSGETDAGHFARFRSIARDLSASMTFFLTGLYVLPAGKRALYRPPQGAVGASDIGFPSEDDVHRTIEQVGKAWLEGHEIGTHFNGHFCGAKGVERWSPQDWDSEIEQAVGFVKTWRTTTGFTDLPPLPFDFDRELVGGRAPCLQGQSSLLRCTRVQTWRYDSSGTGTQVWPRRFPGSNLWNIPIQSIPFPGHAREVLSMDYNIMANQSRNPSGDVAPRSGWRAEAKDAFLAGFERAYGGNRAPLVIGNHFERWNGGIYLDALEAAVREMASRPDVRLVSLRQLVDWVEAQDLGVLARLQGLGVGQPPRGGWAQLTA